LSEVSNIHEAGGASFIYRENNSRYIGVQFSIQGRDLQTAVRHGQRAIKDIAKSLPSGYRLEWGGEYGELLQAEHQMEYIGPMAVLIIFMILFALYGNLKFPLVIALGVILTVPVGALIALKMTNTPFSCFVGTRIARIDGRIGRDSRDSLLVYQQTASGKQRYSHGNPRGLPLAPATHHDDRPCGLSGALACSCFPRASALTLRSLSRS
jgi:hypothetical protein